MSSLKVIQVQAKSIKVTCSSSCGGVGRSNFTSSKTHSDYGKDLDTLIDSAMANAQKIKKKSKSKAKDKFKLGYELEFLTLKL